MEELEKQVAEIKADVKYIRRKLSFLEGKVAGISIAVAAITSIAIAVLVSGCAASMPTLSGGERFNEYVVGLVHDNGNAYCTGFLIENYIVTAAHCVEHGPIRVGYYDGLKPNRNGWRTSFPSELLVSDSVSDVAILSRRSGRRLSFRLRYNPVVVGENITAVGHPFLVPYQHTHGRVAHGQRNRSVSWPTEPFFTTDAILLPGMSGGPAIDANGMVVGIVSFTFGLGGVVPTESINNLIGTLR